MTAKKTKPKRPEVGGMLDAVLEASRREAKIIEELRVALEEGDDEEALEKARELTGLPRKRNGGLSQ